MRILVTIQHAENVHFFRHAIEELEALGHEVGVFAREKEVNLSLLSAYDIDHTVLCGAPDGLLGLAAVQVAWEARLLPAAWRFDPDVVVSSHGIAGPHVARLLGVPNLNFVDTDAHIAAQHHLFIPFSDRVYTPATIQSDFGDHQVRYDGHHELAYLHPSRFDPDPSVLTRRGVDPDDTFFFVRLNAWDAHHDVGKTGLTRGQVQRLVDDLSAVGDVYVSHEGGLPPGLSAHRLPVAPHEVLHLVAYADLVVGDVSTMTGESAVLGVPTVRISPFATEHDMGKFHALEDDYGLVYSFHTSQAAQGLETARALARDPGATAAFTERRHHLVEDSIDVTAFVVDRILEHGQRDAGVGPVRRARSLAEAITG